MHAETTFPYDLLDANVGFISSVYFTRRPLWFSDCQVGAAVANEWLAVSQAATDFLEGDDLNHLIKRRALPMVGGGIDTTQTGVIQKAVGECIERVCARVFPGHSTDIREASYGALSREFDLPSLTRFQLLTANQLAHPRCQLHALDPYARIRWVRTIRPGGRESWLPISLAYLEAPLWPEERLCELMSTGLASHVTVAEARLGGLCEVIERDAVMGMWLNRLSPPRLDLELCRKGSDRTAHLLDEFARTTFEVWIHDLTTEFEVPIRFVTLNLPAPPYTVVGAAAHPDGALATEKALFEATMGLAYFCEREGLQSSGLLSRTSGERTLLADEDFTDIKDHPELYARNDLRGRLGFLADAGQGQAPRGSPLHRHRTPLELLEWTCAQVEAKGFQVHFADLSIPELFNRGFHVHRAMVPGLLPLNNLPIHAPFGAPRLNDFQGLFPRRYRYPDPLNPWPHPFP